MAKNFEHIIHKHSATVTDGNPKLPVATDLELGELAVNYAKDNETISLKNSNNEIVTFSSDSQINEKFYTKEEIDDDHLVISSSLNDLNTRVISAENVIETVKVNGTALTPDESKAVDITVPSAVTESTVSGWGFTKNTGTYTKPSAGIPKSDLASDVQTSLGKADTALQSFTETDPVFTASAAHGITAQDIANWNAKQDALQFDEEPTENSNKMVTSGSVYKFLSDDELVISSALNDLNTRALSLESRMDTAEDDIASKQETLVSGTNIKTINGNSILGEGNISIEGGSGGGGDTNVIETVKVNGTALTPDANKAVNITSVPSSIVTQDAAHRFVSDTEKTIWNEKQDALKYGELKGSLYRNNVGGGGAISISGTTGEFPTVTTEGTYIVVTEMSSSTQSYGLNVTFGGNTYSLSTTNGKISDSREIVISSNKTWSASVTDSVASGTILSVKLYLVSGNVSVLGLVAVTNDYNDLLNKPTIPAAVTESTVSGWGFTKNTGTVTGVKMNGTTKNPSSGVVDLGTVITSHQDISGKADKSAAIGSLSLSLDSTNYKITLSGTKVDGTTFTVSDVIDLPLESVVVNGSYNNTTKKVVLTLQNGSTVEFSVADLVSGLQSEITSTNKLSADLIADGTTNKVVTASEKSTWNGKQDALTNATVLGGITSTKVSNWDSAATNSHTHSNKSVLDGIKATDITNWNGKTSNVGTITGITMNGASKGTSGVVDLGTVITSHQDISGKADKSSLATVATSGSYNDLSDKPTIPAAQVQSDWNATTGMGVILNKPTIPSAPGTLKTNNTKAQTASASESLSGTINLHKVAKTGTYSDLIGTPTIPSAPGTLTTTATAAQSTATNESLSGNIALHKVSKTGSYNDLNNKPTIPTVNNATITIKNGSTTLGTFTVNASSNVEIDISSALPIGVPSYTSADNGKILGVVNGQLAWVTPTTIYTGTGTPSSSQGNDGDIYLQTS